MIYQTSNKRLVIQIKRMLKVSKNEYYNFFNEIKIKKLNLLKYKCNVIKNILCTYKENILFLKLINYKINILMGIY